MVGRKISETGETGEEGEYSSPLLVDMLGMFMNAFFALGVMLPRVPLQNNALLPDESYASELQELQTPLIQSKAASDPVRSRLG